jgi:predicted CoA-substrate-specific enzyme activase
MMSIHVCGVDIGSTQTKAVLLNEKKEIVAKVLTPTGANVIKAGENAFKVMLEETKLKAGDVAFVAGTGYGRFKVTFGNAQITEISCHAKGANLIFPNTRTVIDMGGQDTKVIRVGKSGEVNDFVMNDKCAAGTGRFLAACADVADCSLDDIGPLSLQSTKLVRLTSVCTVFVESEIMSYIAKGEKLEDILAGVHGSIAARTISLVRRVGVEDEVSFTGGVARNIGMVKALEKNLNVKLNINPLSHFMGAIGAAVFALERALVLAEAG